MKPFLTVSLQMYGVSKASIEVHNILPCFHVLCVQSTGVILVAPKKMSKSLPTDPIFLARYANITIFLGLIIKHFMNITVNYSITF